jgi:hypothetical protein
MPETLSVRGRAVRYVSQLPRGMRVTSRDLSRVLDCSIGSASGAVSTLSALGLLVEVRAAGQPATGQGSSRTYLVAAQQPAPAARDGSAPGRHARDRRPAVRHLLAS